MDKKRRLERKKRRSWLGIPVIIFFVWILGNILFYNAEGLSSLWENVSQGRDSRKISQPGEWNLVVVNRWNVIPEDYSVTLTELSNGQKVDSRIYPYLQEMFDEMRAEGIYPIVREGYRTAEEQEKIFNEKVQAYMNEGYSRAGAERIAKGWVALPGTSEHQLGIAVDINADKTRSVNAEVYVWLAENAHKYGFILRYPQGKEEITGTEYEPWHYRYVGMEAAEEIFNNRICLEEYFDGE